MQSLNHAIKHPATQQVDDFSITVNRQSVRILKSTHPEAAVTVAGIRFLIIFHVTTVLDGEVTSVSNQYIWVQV